MSGKTQFVRHALGIANQYDFDDQCMTLYEKHIARVCQTQQEFEVNDMDDSHHNKFHVDADFYDAFIVCCPVNDQVAFDSLEDTRRQLSLQCPDSPALLLITKTDMLESTDDITMKQFLTKKQELGYQSLQASNINQPKSCLNALLQAIEMVEISRELEL